MTRAARLRPVATLVLMLLAHVLPAQEPAKARFVDGALRSRLGGIDLRIDLDRGVPWRVFTLTGPDRLVVDLRGLDWTGADTGAMRLTEEVTVLRVGAYRPGWSRLVAVLRDPMPLRRAALSVDEATGVARLNVRLGRADRAAFDAAAGAPPADPGRDLPEPAVERPFMPGQGPVRVMIDPGHGGLDPGAEAPDVSEADLMLTFARDLRVTLLAAGFEVAMTREGDHFVSLGDRVAQAHAAQADVFLSLHADSLDRGQARGAAIYTLGRDASDGAAAALARRHERDDLLAGAGFAGADDTVAKVLTDLARQDTAPRSRALAARLVDGIRASVGGVHKRPLREADFGVLRSAGTPSVLVELGFLSTPQDLHNLRDPQWRAAMADGLRDGLLAWQGADAALSPLRRR